MAVHKRPPIKTVQPAMELPEVQELTRPRRQGLLSRVKLARGKVVGMAKPGTATLEGRTFTFSTTDETDSGFLVAAEAAQVVELDFGFSIALVKDDANQEDLRLQMCFACSEYEQLAWLRCFSAALSLSPLLRKIVPSESVVLKEMIGMGAFGFVFRGTAEVNGQKLTVAAKLLREDMSDQECRTDFVQEGAIQAQLDHPNLPILYGICCLMGIPDTGCDDVPVLCLLTEYMSSGDLKRRLHALNAAGQIVGPTIPGLSAAEFVAIGTGIADGLGYLHQNSIVHRDIKPENIMLDERGLPKIIDFGQSRLVTERYMTANTRGSLLWRAPEMMDTKRAATYGVAADVYSLAITLWEMFKQDEPFKEIDSTWKIMTGVAQGTLRPSLAGLPSRLAIILQWGWCGDPEKRPTAEEVAALLENPRLLEPQATKSQAAMKHNVLTESEVQLTPEEPSSAPPFRLSLRELLNESPPPSPMISRLSMSRPNKEPELSSIQRRAALLEGKDLLDDIPAMVCALRQPPASGGLGLSDRKFLGYRVRDCFRGKELIAWLVNRCQCSSETAMAVGQYLREAGFIRHTVCSFKFSANCFFFFRPAEVVEALVHKEEEAMLLRSRRNTLDITSLEVRPDRA